MTANPTHEANALTNVHQHLHPDDRRSGLPADTSPIDADSA
jgi:hypothetical protein